MYYHQKPILTGDTEGQHTFLTHRMIWVWECERKRIAENGNCIFKWYSML